MKTATIYYLAPILLTFFMVASTSSAASHLTPPPSSPGGCADSVISFSPCLPYISAPPNDLSDDPSSQCCDIFNGAFDSGEAECLCYLVRHSTLLGFPINASKLLSLSDLCSLNNNNNTTDLSLQSICSASPTLPPLMSTPNKPHPGSSKAPPPPPITTKPSSSKNASIPVRPPPTSKPHRNNGNHLEPTYAIVLFSTYMLVFFPMSILHQFTAGMEVDSS